MTIWNAEKHDRLVDTDKMLFVAATGAGAGIQRALWEQPGASRYLAGAAFPYSEREIADFIGFTPERFCSKETAMDMAIAAYIRAKASAGDRGAMGLGVTASVASHTAHRGDHRYYIALLTDDRCSLYMRTLTKSSGAGARFSDGIKVDDQALLELDQHNQPETEKRFAERLEKNPGFYVDGRRATVNQIQAAVKGFVPGAFNPPHAGHYGMANDFEQPVAFMLEKNMPHKPSLTVTEILDRVARFRAEGQTRFPLVVTHGLPLFIDKANLFPKRTFIIGADAYNRMLETKDGRPRWGTLNQEQLFCAFGNMGTDFIVYPRDDQPMPPIGVTRNGLTIFKHQTRKPWGHISSSQLREQAGMVK